MSCKLYTNSGYRRVIISQIKYQVGGNIILTIVKTRWDIDAIVKMNNWNWDDFLLCHLLSIKHIILSIHRLLVLSQLLLLRNTPLLTIVMIILSWGVIHKTLLPREGLKSDFETMQTVRRNRIIHTTIILCYIIITHTVSPSPELKNIIQLSIQES